MEPCSILMTAIVILIEPLLPWGQFKRIQEAELWGGSQDRNGNQVWSLRARDTSSQGPGSNPQRFTSIGTADDYCVRQSIPPLIAGCSIFLRHLCTQSPGIVTHDLSTKIELLVDMISQLDSSQDLAARMQSTLNIQQPPAGESLLNIAQQVALEANVVPTRSARGSVTGDSLGLNTRSRIETWLEENASEGNYTEISSTSVTSRTQMTPSETTDYESVAEVPPAPDSDTYESFEIEEIQASIRLARSASDKADYSMAEQFLRRAADITQDLSLPKRNEQFLNLCQVCPNIVQIAFDKANYSAAEKFFNMATSLSEPLSAPKRIKLNVHLFQACLDIAQAAFEKTEHSTAEVFFRKAVSLAPDSSATKQTERDLRDIKLRIAVCCFHLQKFKEAEAAIVDLRELPIVSLADTIRPLNASHLLGEIYLSIGSLNNAKLECEKALKGKRKTLGTKCRSYYRTLALRSILMETVRDSIAAEVSREVIRKAISDRNLQTSPGDSGKGVLDVGQVEKLRGLCPIEAVLGITEIDENFTTNLRRSHLPDSLLHYACEKELCVATRLLTAWSPTSYLHRLPGYPTISNIVGSSIPWICGPGSSTLLHKAALKQNVNMVEVLVNAGASLSARDGRSMTPCQAVFNSAPKNAHQRPLFNLLQHGKRIVGEDVNSAG
jgi:tetratricopeptide (TPR) repeat protein